MVLINSTEFDQLFQYAQHLKQLSIDDREMRFGYNISDRGIDQLILTIVYEPQRHKFWTASDGDNILGWGHLAQDSNSQWELAVSVDAEHRGQGTASRLVETMLQYARLNSITEICMHCLERNLAVRHIAEKHNLRILNRSTGEITSNIIVPEPGIEDISRQVLRNQTDIMANWFEMQQRAIGFMKNPAAVK